MIPTTAQGGAPSAVASPLKDLLNQIGLTAHHLAARASVSEQVQLLSACARDWEGMAVGTFWEHGVYDTTNGVPFRIPWQELGQNMAQYAHHVVPKKEGLWYSPVISRNGGCCDADVEWITQLSLDADGVGEWHRLRHLLDASGLAYIAARSSRHSPARAKWHLHVPLAFPWSGTKLEWRIMYRYCVGLWSALAGLECDLSGKPPVFGFDRATDRLGQPWFFSARQSSASCPQPVVTRMGWALDLGHMLESCGLEVDGVLACLQANSTLKPTRRKRSRQKETVDGSQAKGALFQEVDAAKHASLLELAFAEAGWLGRQLTNGARAVRCPWAHLHSTGEGVDGSAVIFPASSAGGPGWLHCSHGHCRDRSQEEVLLALPPLALRAAVLRQMSARRGGVM